jgi:hypothetical protein
VLRGSAQGAVHRVGGVALQCRDEVGVHVEGDGDAGAADHPGHDFEWDTLGEGEGDGGVPEGVKATSAEPCAFSERVEPVGQVAGVDRCSDRRGEDEARLVPRGTRGEAFLGLVSAMNPQGVEAHCGERHGTAAACGFRLAEHESGPGTTSADPGDPVERADDRDGACIEVAGVPLEPECLALP